MQRYRGRARCPKASQKTLRGGHFLRPGPNVRDAPGGPGTFNSLYQKAADVCKKDVWEFQVFSQTFFELRFSLGNEGKDVENLNSQTWRHPRPSYCRSRFLGRGSDEALFSEEKGRFSEKGGGIQ